MSQPPRDGRPCPICGKGAEEKFRPFCSKRCADLDLGRWLKGGYAIPARAEPDDEEDSQRDDDDDAPGIH